MISKLNRCERNETDLSLTSKLNYYLVCQDLMNTLNSLANGFRELIIVHVRQHIGNLKKTYLSRPQRPMFEKVGQTADVLTCWWLDISSQLLNGVYQRICTIIRSHGFIRLETDETFFLRKLGEKMSIQKVGVCTKPRKLTKIWLSCYCFAKPVLKRDNQFL